MTLLDLGPGLLVSLDIRRDEQNIFATATFRTSDGKTVERTSNDEAQIRRWRAQAEASL